MLFCCFSFQGFSLSTFSTKTVTRSGARVRRGRSSLFLSWGCSIFGLDRIPSFAQNGLFSPTREKYSSLLPSRKKFGSRRKRGGRKRGEREGERVRTFFTYLGSAMGPRLWIVIASASSVHPSSILSGKKLPWTQNFVTFAGKGSHFARPNHFAFKSKKFWFALKVEGCQNAGLRSDCESNCWWCSWMLNKHRRWLNYI